MFVTNNLIILAFCYIILFDIYKMPSSFYQQQGKWTHSIYVKFLYHTNFILILSKQILYTLVIFSLLYVVHMLTSLSYYRSYSVVSINLTFLFHPITWSCCCNTANTYPITLVNAVLVAIQSKLMSNSFTFLLVRQLEHHYFLMHVWFYF